MLVLLLSTAGATVQGSIGIGYALVAGAGLVAIDAGFVPGPLLLVGLIVGCRHVIAEREHLEQRALKRALFGLPFGMAAGLVLLTSIDDRTLGLLVGATTAMAATALLLGWSVRRTPRVEVLTGAATAFSSVTAGLPGPPFVVAFSDLRPAALRATAGSFIMIVAVLGFVALAATGNFGLTEFSLLALLVPGTLIGLFLSRFVRPHLDRPWFRPLILIVSGVGGLALVVRSL